MMSMLGQRVFDLEVVRRELPSWGPGAHIDLEISGELTRQYFLVGYNRAAWSTAALRKDSCPR